MLEYVHLVLRSGLEYYLGYPSLYRTLTSSARKGARPSSHSTPGMPPLLYFATAAGPRNFVYHVASALSTLSAPWSETPPLPLNSRLDSSLHLGTSPAALLHGGLPLPSLVENLLALPSPSKIVMKTAYITTKGRGGDRSGIVGLYHRG